MGATVRSARAQWTPVWVVVDGSSDGSSVFGRGAGFGCAPFGVFLGGTFGGFSFSFARTQRGKLCGLGFGQHAQALGFGRLVFGFHGLAVQFAQPRHAHVDRARVQAARVEAEHAFDQLLAREGFDEGRLGHHPAEVGVGLAQHPLAQRMQVEIRMPQQEIIADSTETNPMMFGGGLLGALISAAVPTERSRSATSRLLATIFGSTFRASAICDALYSPLGRAWSHATTRDATVPGCGV